MSDTNAIKNLYDFINTRLPLTVEEERVLKYRSSLAAKTKKEIQTDDNHKQCIKCGEIKLITEFYRPSQRLCKLCYNAKRREEYKKTRLRRNK